MTVTKQIERNVEKIKSLHAKTETLIKEIFSLQKKMVSTPNGSSKAKVAMTTKPEKAGKARAGRGGGVNKSELIRAYFEKHGKDSRPRDVIEYLGKDGVEVGAALVSIIKTKLGAAPSKKVSLKTKESPAVSKSKKGSDLPLPAVCLEVLSKNKDGLKLGDLANKVEEAGYKYGGDKGHKGLVQNVYQCLYSLSKEKSHPGFEGTDPVVLHDETSKRYVLNPKAKRSA
jgi:hypothetical protein